MEICAHARFSRNKLGMQLLKSYPGEVGGGREDLTAPCRHPKGSQRQMGLVSPK